MGGRNGDSGAPGDIKVNSGAPFASLLAGL